jgi:hypothetical protein
MGTSDNLVAQLAASVLQYQPQSQTAPRTDIAAIHTPLRMPNSFAVRMEMESRSNGGRIDLGPYQGYGAGGYRLAYYPREGLALLRVGSGGAVRIGTGNRRVNLDDGRLHRIDWERDPAGRMTVSVDGQTVISARDTAYRQGFDGFLIVNGGGEYYIRSVAIDGAGS